MRSRLQDVRLSYQPKIPSLLQQLSKIHLSEGETPKAELEAMFPKTGKQSLLHFALGKSRVSSTLKVGVVLSGGQAAGGHNVIIGLFDALKALHPESELIGFVGGPSGLVENQSILLTQSLLSDYRNTGGFDLIGSGRTKIETESQMEATKESLRGFDGLVVIGGDDSNTNAALLAEYLDISVIGVPKTIDGDLKNAYIETSFGFDTATKTYSEMIGNIARDALSAKKYFHFVKLMGRSASHIALECALQTHPNLTLIGEEIEAEGWTLEMIVDQIVQLAKKRTYGVILIPEGVVEFIPQMRTLIDELNRGKLSEESKALMQSMPKDVQDQFNLERDPHGNVQVSHIETEKLLIHLAKERVKFNAVSHFFGYEGRSGFPSNFDANYTDALGRVAALLIDQKKTGYMAALSNLSKDPTLWEPQAVPLPIMMALEERKGKMKPVITKALVDLQGAPFKEFKAHRESWKFNDDYQFPGGIQYFGPLADAIAATLQL